MALLEDRKALACIAISAMAVAVMHFFAVNPPRPVPLGIATAVNYVAMATLLGLYIWRARASGYVSGPRWLVILTAVVAAALLYIAFEGLWLAREANADEGCVVGVQACSVGP